MKTQETTRLRNKSGEFCTLQSFIAESPEVRLDVIKHTNILSCSSSDILEKMNVNLNYMLSKRIKIDVLLAVARQCLDIQNKSCTMRDDFTFWFEVSFTGKVALHFDHDYVKPSASLEESVINAYESYIQHQRDEIEKPQAVQVVQLMTEV